MTYGMRNGFEETKPFTAIGVKFKEILLAHLKNQFKDIEADKIFAVSTICDPRFKKWHFQHATPVANAVQIIKNELRKSGQQIRLKSSENLPSTSKDTNNCQSIWKFHDSLYEKQQNKEFNDDHIFSEVTHYLKELPVKRTENPFRYWNTNQQIYPFLYKIALKYLSIPATSVSTERLVSEAGDVKTDDRNKLTAEHLNELMFLSSISEEDWF